MLRKKLILLGDVIDSVETAYTSNHVISRTLHPWTHPRNINHDVYNIIIMFCPRDFVFLLLLFMRKIEKKLTTINDLVQITVFIFTKSNLRHRLTDR